MISEPNPGEDTGDENTACGDTTNREHVPSQLGSPNDYSLFNYVFKRRGRLHQLQ